jgi:hypothetical protein
MKWRNRDAKWSRGQLPPQIGAINRGGIVSSRMLQEKGKENRKKFEKEKTLWQSLSLFPVADEELNSGSFFPVS